MWQLQKPLGAKIQNSNFQPLTQTQHTRAQQHSLIHAPAPAHPLRAGDVALGALRSEIEELASENERLQDLVEAAEEEEVERLRAWAAEAEYTTED